MKVGHKAKQAGYLVEWMIIGSVPWNEENGIDKVFVDEPNIDLQREYTIGDRTLRWSEHLTNHETGMVDLALLIGERENAAAYAYAEVKLEKDQDLLLKIGSNDGFQCWWNGEVAGKFEGGRGYAPDQDTLQVRGKNGVNRILLKVTQMGAAWAFSVRVAKN